jgi:hypothetical protein
MAVQREIQVEAMLKGLMTGLTVDRKQDRGQSNVCYLDCLSQLTATKLDQERRHGRRDVNDSVIEPVADAETIETTLADARGRSRTEDGLMTHFAMIYGIAAKINRHSLLHC